MSSTSSLSRKRETFTSGIAVFFATLSSAVGLGNIWKFPYLTGENGGGAFILIYLISTFLIGVPVMVGEFFIGRRTKKNVVGAFEVFKAKPAWKLVGYISIMVAFFMVFFYSAVAGWVYSYVFKAIKGGFSDLSKVNIQQAVSIADTNFNSTVNGNFSPMVWQIIVLLVVSTILIAGVKNGIEKVTKTLMPVLFILIIICVVRAMTLPKAGEGLKFLFNIDFSKINSKVILAGMGLAFFKLSVGMGTMVTYGSYFTEDNNMIGTACKVAISDMMVSMLAGMAIFPVVFQFGLTPGAGPGLLFKTIPLVFSKMPFGNILLVAFFLLCSIAATTAMISMVEVIVAFFNEEMKIERTKAVILVFTIIALVGVMTVHPKSLLGNVHLMGKNFFDLFDCLSSNVFMPISGFAIAIFVGYFIKKEDILDEFSNKGNLKNKFIINFFYNIIKYITPLLILIVFLTSIGVIK